MTEEIEVLDPARLAMLRQLADADMPDIAKEVAEIFIRTTQERVAKLCEAAERGDHKQARDDAHSIKGSAGELGATQVFEQSREIEQSAILGETTPAQAAALSEALQTAYGALRREFMLSG